MDGALTAPGEVYHCAVLGSPIAHSLSPALHAAAYRHLGLAWHYGRHEVASSELPAFLAGLDESWRGLSLTMPLKHTALGCVNEVSDLAALVAAVNTVILAPDGLRFGDNTDVPGLVAALQEQNVTQVPYAAVLGAGATARSALVSLSKLTTGVDVYVRTESRAQDLRRLATGLDVSCDIRPWSERTRALRAPLLVSTVPAGAADDLAAGVPGRPGVLFDVVYHPWPTPLARAWAAADGQVLGGLDLLIHQAVLQVRLMTGRDVPVRVLREAGQYALARPPG